MTDPIRPTDAELEAGRARLMGFTIAPMPTSEETFRAQVLGRTVREQTPPEAPEYINLESVWEHCMLEGFMTGRRVDNKRCNTHADAQAVADLARSLGYTAEVNESDDSWYAVVKAPELEVAL